MSISHIKPYNIKEYEFDRFDIDPKGVAKSINEGPQKRVLDKLDTINSQYILPRRHYSIRTKSDKYDPLEITENFRWKRGYRDKIIDVINNKFNQYNKSSASLQGLLKNRPERTQWQKDDFINNVIDVDKMMRQLRARKETFANNENVFGKLYDNYLQLLENNWQTFSDYISQTHPNMNFSYKLINKFDQENHDKQYTDLIFNNTWLQYTLHWKDVEIPVMTDTGRLIHTIKLGDMIMTWTIRLFPVIQELINKFYRRLPRNTVDELLEFDRFQEIVSRIQYHTIQGYKDNPFRNNGEMAPTTLRGNERNRWHLQHSLDRIGCMSRAVMINGRNIDLNQSNLMFGNDRSMQSLNVLSHPYINNVDVRRSDYDSNYNENDVEYQTNNLLGRYRVPSNNSEGHYDLDLQTICWGDVHGDMWTSLLKCDFVPWVYHINHWNRYSIPGSNPLNNISKTHFGMPKDFPLDYKNRISQNSRQCFEAKLRLHQLEASEIEGDNMTINSSARRSIYSGYEDSYLTSEQKVNKLSNLLKSCDEIQCVLRQHCDWYTNYANRLNLLYRTDEVQFPYGNDIYGLTQQANEESDNIEAPEVDSIPELPSFGDEYDPEDDPTGLSPMRDEDLHDVFALNDIVRTNEGLPTLSRSDNTYTEDQIQQVESEEQISEEQNDMAEQMRTWAAARRRG